METRHLVAKALKQLQARESGWKSEAEQLNTEQPRGITKPNQILDSWNHNMPMSLVGLMLNELKNVQDISEI